MVASVDVTSRGNLGMVWGMTVPSPSGPDCLHHLD